MIEYWLHFKYTMRHKWYVMCYCFQEGLYWQGITHDLSKFTLSEFPQYAQYYFTEETDKKYAMFCAARRHHETHNPHHWEHWIKTSSECVFGIMLPVRYIYNMPDKYVLEMICDWRAAGKAKGTSDGSFKSATLYYEQSKHRMTLSDATRRKLEAIFRGQN